jgi:ankyrin repeat protein
VEPDSESLSQASVAQVEAQAEVSFMLVQGARTALHLAAELGHRECVEHLLEKGAAVDAKTFVSTEIQSDEILHEWF